jgi:hypothetical protein
MNRIFDLLVALGLMLIFAPLFLLMVLAVRLTSTGPVRFRTRRVGKNSRLFTMYKFRTMRMDAPQVAAHLLKEPDQFFANIQAGLPILATINSGTDLAKMRSHYPSWDLTKSLDDIFSEIVQAWKPRLRFSLQGPVALSAPAWLEIYRPSFPESKSGA